MTSTKGSHSQKGTTTDTELKVSYQVGRASKVISCFAHFDENYCDYCMLKDQQDLAAL
jgi:hypothetical protein